MDGQTLATLQQAQKKIGKALGKIEGQIVDIEGQIVDIVDQLVIIVEILNKEEHDRTNSNS